MSQSHGTRADVKRWSPALKQHVSPKVMITVTCGFMLHGPIRRRRVNWQRLMWRGGGPARLLTGEIIANKGTPLWMIDRLRGKRPRLPSSTVSWRTSAWKCQHVREHKDALVFCHYWQVAHYRCECLQLFSYSMCNIITILLVWNQLTDFYCKQSVQTWYFGA